MLPIELYLLQESQAGVGEHGVLCLWVENLSTDVITAIQLSIDDVGHPLFFQPFKGQDRQLSPGMGRWCPVHFTTAHRGTVMVTVRVQVWFGGHPLSAVTEHPLQLRLEPRRADGSINLGFEQGGMASEIRSGGGDIHVNAGEGAFTKLRSDGGNITVLLKKSGIVEELDARAPDPLARASVHAGPSKGTLEQVPLMAPWPAWARAPQLDLPAVQRAWPIGPALVDLCFVDGFGQPRTGWVTASPGPDVTRDHEFKLRARLHQPGHLTLISQGATGRLYILAPSALDQGDARAKRLSGAELLCPGQLLQLPLCADTGLRILLGFSSAGTEHALALLTREPLFEQVPADPFVGYDPGDTNSPVHQALRTAWFSRGAAVALATVHVRELGAPERQALP